MKRAADTLSRQWLILKRVPAHPLRISTAEMHDYLRANGYDVDVRTTQRDLDQLSNEFPLTSKKEGRTNYWQWAKGAYSIEIPSMSPNAALAFSLIDRYVGRLLPNGTLELLQPYISRANGLLTTQFRNWTRNVCMIGRGPILSPPPIEDKVQEVVYTALLERRRFSVYYRTRGNDEPMEYIVNPQAIVIREGITYLIATLWDYDDIKHLVLHRMSFPQLLDEPSKRLENFHLQTYVREEASFAYPVSRENIRLEVRFDRHTAQHLYESSLSSDQVLTPDGDDHVVLTATVRDSSEIRWWLLGFGDRVEVLGPEPLREEFRETASRLASMYS